MKKSLQRVLPWLVAAVIFYFLFRQIPPAKVWATVRQANGPLFIFYAVGYFIIVMLVDCVGLKWLIRRFSTNVSFKETILMRGATYLLMVVNYNLAQGGIAFYLRRTHKTPVFRTLGAMMYLTVIDLTLILSFSFLAAQFGEIVYRGVSLRPVLTRFAVLFYAGFILWVLFWHFIDRPALKPLRKLKGIEWIVSHNIFVTFRQAKAGDYAKTILLRIPTVMLVVFSFFLWIHAFNSFVPVASVMLYVPVIMVLGTLPITPSGMGTSQAICVELFKGGLSGPLLKSGQFSAAEIILAGSLLWGMANLVLKVLFGFYCLKQKSRSLFEEIKSPQI